MSFFDNKNYWIKELSDINSNIPTKRVPLKILLQKSPENRFFETKSGKYYIPEKEFDLFLSQFHNEMYSSIYLPIVILQRKDMYVTSGTKIDSWLVEKLLGYEDMDILLSVQDYIPKHSYYYAYQVNKIRKKFPNIIQIAYSM